MTFKLTSFLGSFALSGLLVCTAAAQAGTHGSSGHPHAEPTPQLPAQELTRELLFMMLLAEIAGARGELAVSVEAYLELARSTRDPRIAKRATEIALFARDLGAATEAARVWSDTAPDSDEARRVLAGILANSGERLNEVQIQLARILALSPDQLEQNLLGLNRALARVPDRQIVRSIVFRLTEPYLDEAAAHFARAQAEAGAEDGMGALSAIEEALELRPGWEPAVQFKTQLLIQLDATKQALEFLREQIYQFPENGALRMTYARTLVTAGEYGAARVQFQHLLDDAPGDRELLYAIALVTSHLGEYEQAAALFERALEAGHLEADNIRMNLGHIAERRNRPDEAVQWYRGVGSGRDHLDAQVRIAILTARQGDVEAARMHLRSLDVERDERRRLLLAETLILREAGRYAEALQLIDDALREEPESGELLYESAMLAERLDRLNIMEARLRKLIAIDPDHAHAYNALGYTFADRGMRLEEAESLIVRALELAPNDPFILDSMGWVRFRRNDPATALEHLERAYALRPDPEIAAHLGEVLWTLDRREDAIRIWEAALQEHPDNETLGDTVRRLKTQ